MFLKYIEGHAPQVRFTKLLTLEGCDSIVLLFDEEMTLVGHNHLSTKVTYSPECVAIDDVELKIEPMF